MTQARLVQSALARVAPGHECVVREIVTQGDRSQASPLSRLDEGIFVRELEHALLRGEIDLAVHSLKDLPTAIPSGLTIAAVPARANPQDVVVTRDGASLSALKAGSVVGTSSLRRRAQLLGLRSDLKVEELRGNVDTRIRKLREGRYDAIIAAAAGLIRLGLEGVITEYLPLDRWLPAPAQGALGIEAREGDDELLEIVGRLDDPDARACVIAERSLMNGIGAGCQVPLSALARMDGDRISMRATITSLDGTESVGWSHDAPSAEAEGLGMIMAARLLAEGGRRILEEIRGND